MIQTSEPKPIALAIIWRRSEVLVGKRPEAGSWAGMWEFPGGKIDSGETAQEAVRRECREEMGCEVEPLELLATVDHRYPSAQVRLQAVLCKLQSGEIPRPIFHQELAWISFDLLKENRFLRPTTS